MKSKKKLKEKLKWGEAIDPVTGDRLTLGERASWLIQGVIRRWTFLIVITLVTITVWILNNPTGLLWWNLCASYLAIFIESVVGLAMFNQTRRDAVVIREIRAMDQKIQSLTEKQTRQTSHIEKEIEAIKSELEETA